MSWIRPAFLMLATMTFASIAGAAEPPAAAEVPSPAAAKPEIAADAGSQDGRDQIIPEVRFEDVPLEQVVEFLQDASKSFRAVVVRQKGADSGPMVTMRLRKVSVGQILDVLAASYEGLQIASIDGPNGPVHVITLPAPALPAGVGGEPERAVRVYRLATIVDSLRGGPDVSDGKVPLNNTLSLIKATLALTASREQPTLQIHEETQTLIFKGNSEQRQALEDVLSALESRSARPQTEVDQLKRKLEQMQERTARQQEQMLLEVTRATKDADSRATEAAKRVAEVDGQMRMLKDVLQEREIQIAKLEAMLSVQKSAGGK